MIRLPREGWIVPALLVGGSGAVGLLAGPWSGFGVLAVGTVVLAGFHLHNVERLARWAADDLDAAVPESGGAWNRVFSALHRRVRRRGDLHDAQAQTIARFRSLAEAIPDGMAVIDAENRVQWANSRAVNHLGLDPGRDLGLPLANVVRQPEFVAYLDAGDYSASLLIDSPRSEGQRLQLQIIPFGIDDKLLVSRDVTQLEAVARLRRDFIANVSHELKTPLTVVAGFVETLQDIDVDPARLARYLGLIEGQTRSMQRLVDDLLTLSSLESEQHPADEALIDPAELVAERLAEAKLLSAGRHTVESAVAGTALLTGSRDEIGSALANLLSNAVRYTPAGGSIRVDWGVDGDGRGVLAVTDTGIGIAGEHIPRLTERFYRVDRSRSRATGGTGLGLAIVKHVLLRHQAELEIRSEPGHGSEFRFVFPASRVRQA